jgi:hypothetical protein
MVRHDLLRILWGDPANSYKYQQKLEKLRISDKNSSFLESFLFFLRDRLTDFPILKLEEWAGYEIRTFLPGKLKFRWLSKPFGMV